MAEKVPLPKIPKPKTVYRQEWRGNRRKPDVVFVLEEYEGYSRCPYNPHHVVSDRTRLTHLMLCREEYNEAVRRKESVANKIEVCEYDVGHHLPADEMEEHYKTCSGLADMKKTDAMFEKEYNKYRRDAGLSLCATEQDAGLLEGMRGYKRRVEAILNLDPDVQSGKKQTGKQGQDADTAGKQGQDGNKEQDGDTAGKEGQNGDTTEKQEDNWDTPARRRRYGKRVKKQQGDDAVRMDEYGCVTF